MAVEITNNVYASLASYFKTLTNVGYMNQSNVNKLIIYIFLNNLLTGDLSVLISEDDYKEIQHLLSCMYGSNCLMPYPQFNTGNNVVGPLFNLNSTSFKITEGSNIRFTEDNKTRMNNSTYSD